MTLEVCTCYGKSIGAWLAYRACSASADCVCRQPGQVVASTCCYDRLRRAGQAEVQLQLTRDTVVFFAHAS